MTRPPRPTSIRGIPTGIWLLGLVSLLMDISSESVHAIFPIYLVTVLGTSALTVGIIEGIAEATAAITKVFSGALSDWLGKRKFLAAAGYGLAAFTKPIFPLATTVGWLVAARFIDRIGKGIRGAPRDALIADIAPPDKRGASFGLRQTLDTVGAFLGPLLAILLMWLTADNFKAVFWVAVVPAFVSFGLIALAVREPDRPGGLRKVHSPLSRAELARLGSGYWLIVAVATVFTLARFSEAFLILRSVSVGLPIYLAPIVMVLMNLVYSLAAYPAGTLSDRMDRTTVLAIGMATLVIADLFLGLSPEFRRRGGRSSLVGPPHGPYPGAALRAGRRRGTARASRYRLRHVQPRDRGDPARRQRYCRRLVGCRRSGRDVPRRRGICGAGSGGLAGNPPPA